MIELGSSPRVHLCPSDPFPHLDCRTQLTRIHLRHEGKHHLEHFRPTLWQSRYALDARPLFRCIVWFNMELAVCILSVCMGVY
jgi:hypothetical protein